MASPHRLHRPQPLAGLAGAALCSLAVAGVYADTALHVFSATFHWSF